MTIKDLNKKKKQLLRDIEILEATKKELESYAIKKNAAQLELKRRLANSKNGRLRYSCFWSIFGDGNPYENDAERIEAVKQEIQATTSPKIFSAYSDLLAVYYKLCKS